MEECEKINVLQLLPQRPPFVMIDKLCHFDTETTVTSFEVRPQNLFLERNRLSASGLMENIAQTCAARLGYINYITRTKVRIGYIGAVRNFFVYRFPKTGERLTTKIVVKEDVFQMTLAEAEVKSNEEIIARAEIKIAVSDVEAQI